MACYWKLSLSMKNGFASVFKTPLSVNVGRQVSRICRKQTREICSKTGDETGRIASKEPFEVSLKPGKRYFWCRCGLSNKQPWCDGSHKGSGFTPVKFTVDVEEPQAFLCGCKQTETRPYCDGTHGTSLVQDHTDS